MTVHYSTRALQNKHTIDLCDNDCGAYIYRYNGQYYNAEITKKDSLHKDTCSVLLKTWMIAESLNWFPDYSFLHHTEKLIEDIVKMYRQDLTVKDLLATSKSLYDAAIKLDISLHARKVKNEESRKQWKEEKERKKAERTRRANNRQ